MPVGVYAHKGHPLSEETRAKISLALKGKKKPPISEETRRKLVKGLTGRPVSEETRAKIGKANRGKPVWFQGKHWSEEQKKIMSDIRRGEKGSNWQGGKTAESKIIRHSLQYRQWRSAVYERDDYTCQSCGQRGGKLNADHIKPFAYHPKLRFELSNGRTLCHDCHKQTDTWGYRATKMYADLAKLKEEENAH